VSHYLTEGVAILITELLICSHGECPEPRTEMCRDLGEAKVRISRTVREKQELNTESNYVRHEYLITAIFTKAARSVGNP
jgi:hypothetical protein